MSIIYCPKCDDAFDSDHHTEPLCKRCMRDVVTNDNGDEWSAEFADKRLPVSATGRTEAEAIDNLIRAI